MSGWIRIHRDSFEHPLFDGEEMSRREAWFWLIAKAAWKDTRHYVSGHIVPVPRGSLFVTLRELQDAWGWGSTTKVRGFLNALSEDGMISVNSDTRKTQITICKYSEYQNQENTDSTRVAQEEHKSNTLKEEGKKLRKEDTSLRSVSPAPEGACLPEKKNSQKTSKPKNSPVAYSADFEIFWECYPPVDNQSKAKAHEAFARLDKPDRSTAIDGALALMKWLANEVQRRPEAGKFIPHAVTWINQRRWETLLEPNHRSRYEQRPEMH